MSDSVLLAFILLPAAAGAVVLGLRKTVAPAREAITLLVTLVNLALAIMVFNQNLAYTAPWGGFGWHFSLRLYQFSAFIMLAVAGFAFLVALYSWKFMRGKGAGNQFYSYLLIALAMVNGAVLANDLVVLLFFWEGLLIVQFGLIAIGREGAFRTATKAFIIVGITDLCMIFGAVLAGSLAKTLTISEIHLPLDSLASLAMLFLMIGAVSKAGAMPFHSWIPDAAVDAPLPFMAVLPASLEKLLGIYFLARITLDLFAFTPGCWLSTLLMIVGAVTIVLAVMMALVQKDYKKLLSYHAISQVGYMVLGVGTGIPAGIVGGLFHMLNNAMYKSCLFLTGGSVEKQAGTTDLSKLGGLAAKMPITFGCYIVAAVSISGVPPFNGFFSKELVYDAALERHVVYYLAALVGSFFTAASFLKLGHAAYLGKRDASHDAVKEAPVSMLVPMIVIAALCVLFGVYNSLPINHLIQPVLGHARLEGHSFAGMPANMMLTVVTIVVLGGALVNHLAGAKAAGSGLHAVDHIRYAEGLSPIYDKAEKGEFDPYNIGLRVAGVASSALWRLDRWTDWCYDTLIVGLGKSFTAGVRSAHTGNYVTYLIWSLAGAGAIIVFLMGLL